MAFEANKSIVVLGAVTSQYIVEHPKFQDVNIGNPLTDAIRNPHVEICNMTASMVFVAFDRVVVAPAGNGVQGPVNVAAYPITGPIAATPGDFDLAITSGTGWGAIDASVPPSSKYMSVYTVAAGNVVVNYGGQV